MKKTVKPVCSLILACVLFFSAIIPAYAAVPNVPVVSPQYTVFTSANVIGNISDDLLLSATSTFSVDSSQVTRVTITTYVEKRTLLLFWNRVDIGQTNDEWVNTYYSSYNSSYHAFQLSDSGTYRVTSTFRAYNGSTLLETIERSVTL